MLHKSLKWNYLVKACMFCDFFKWSPQENKVFASSLVSSLVKQLMKHMMCYEQPLVKIFYQKYKHGLFSRLKDEKSSVKDEECCGWPSTCIKFWKGLRVNSSRHCLTIHGCTRKFIFLTEAVNTFHLKIWTCKGLTNLFSSVSGGTNEKSTWCVMIFSNKFTGPHIYSQSSLHSHHPVCPMVNGQEQNGCSPLPFHSPGLTPCNFLFPRVKL